MNALIIHRRRRFRSLWVGIILLVLGIPGITQADEHHVAPSAVAARSQSQVGYGSTVASAIVDYAFPCRVTKTGNWARVRDRLGFSDSRLLTEINTVGRTAHGYPALDLSASPANPEGNSRRNFGICDNRDILVARKGTIEKIVNHPCEGWRVMINHGDGQYSKYTHLASVRSDLKVDPTKVYEPGTLLGTMGAPSQSACGFGIHLHFSIDRSSTGSGGTWDNWRVKDPFQQIPKVGNTWSLRYTLTGGWADISFQFGEPGDIPVTGDWNKDGVDTPGVVRGNTWYLKNSLSGGWEDVSFQFGEPGDIPITGDWNGDGIDTPGVVRGDQWFLRNNLTHGWADQSFQYGNPDNIPLVGDWQNTGYSAPGVLQ